MKRFLSIHTRWALMGLAVGVVLIAGCQKTEKKVTAGGGSSTQGVLTIRGSGR